MSFGIDVRYPEIFVQLTGLDGNAFSIMGRVMDALKKADVSKEEIDEYYAQSTSGDYDNLLRTAAEWVSVG
jgi:hypothetical protein